MNEDRLRQALHRAAGTSAPTDARWRDIELDALERSGGRRPRASRRALLAVAAAVAVGVALVVPGDGEAGTREVLAGVPLVDGTSPDLIVESTQVTPGGDRQPVPEAVALALAEVDGVASATGVVRAFARFAEHTDTADRVPTVVVSWEGGEGFQLLEGRPPQGPLEVVLAPRALDELGVAVGDRVRPAPDAPAYEVVGTFDLADGESPVAMAGVAVEQARALAGTDGFDRVHLRLDEGAQADEVAARASIAAGEPYRVLPVNPLGTGQQLLDELAIQAAYIDMLHPDQARRVAAIEGAVADERDRATYERFADQSSRTMLQVRRVSFIDSDHAELTYRVWYANGWSPVVPDPQVGAAVRAEDGRWQVARSTTCFLAEAVHDRCRPVEDAGPPPDAWDDPSTQPEAVEAVRVLADPASSLAARMAAVEDGPEHEAVVAGGLADDARYADAVRFQSSGVRQVDDDAVEVLYAVSATGEPPLETPYPLVVRVGFVDGSWRLPATFACGLVGLVNGGC